MRDSRRIALGVFTAGVGFLLVLAVANIVPDLSIGGFPLQPVILYFSLSFVIMGGLLAIKVPTTRGVCVMEIATSIVLIFLSTYALCISNQTNPNCILFATQIALLVSPMSFALLVGSDQANGESGLALLVSITVYTAGLSSVLYMADWLGELIFVLGIGFFVLQLIVSLPIFAIGYYHPKPT